MCTGISVGWGRIAHLYPRREGSSIFGMKNRSRITSDAHHPFRDQKVNHQTRAVHDCTQRGAQAKGKQADEHWCRRAGSSR